MAFTLDPQTDKLPIRVARFKQFLITLVKEYKTLDDLESAGITDDATGNAILASLSHGLSKLSRYSDKQVGLFYALWTYVFGTGRESAAFFTVTKPQQDQLEKLARADFEETQRLAGLAKEEAQKALAELDGLLKKYGDFGNAMMMATEEQRAIAQQSQQQQSQQQPAQPAQPAAVVAEQQQQPAAQPVAVPSKQKTLISHQPQAQPAAQPQTQPQSQPIQQMQQAQQPQAQTTSTTNLAAIFAEQQRIAGLLGSVRESGSALYEQLAISQDALSKVAAEQLNESPERALMKKVVQLKVLKSLKSQGKPLTEQLLTGLLMAAAAAMAAWVMNKLSAYFDDSYTRSEPTYRPKTDRSKLDDLLVGTLDGSKPDKKTGLPRNIKDQQAYFQAFAEAAAEYVSIMRKSINEIGQPNTLVQRCGFAANSQNAQTAVKLLEETQKGTAAINLGPFLKALRNTNPAFAE